MGTAAKSCYGAPYPLCPIAGSNSTLLLDAQNEGTGMVLVFESYTGSDSDTITDVGLWISAVTGTPDANSYRIGLQSVGADGLPTGTWLAGGNGYADFTPTTTGWFWISLGANTVPLTRNDVVAICCQRVDTTDASNCITTTYASTQFGSTRAGIPYPVTNNASAWAKAAGVGMPVGGMKSANSVYGYPTNGVYTAAAAGTTTEVGFTFTIPTNFCSTFKVKGIRFRGTSPTAGANTYTGTIYSNPVAGSITIEAQSTAIDNDVVGSSAAGDRMIEFYFPASGQATLNAGTEYAFGLSDGGASQIAMGYLSVDAAADLDAYQYQRTLTYCSRSLTDYPPSGNDMNNFTETDTRRMWAELILDDLTAPAGGGGGPLINGRLSL